jgi:hypothetical protein
MLLRILSARGFEITPDLRGRVLACADSDQLGAWAERAAVASSVDEASPRPPTPPTRRVVGKLPTKDGPAAS